MYYRCDSYNHFYHGYLKNIIFVFREVEITSEVTGHAPSPVLNVGVRQDGVLVGRDETFSLF